MQQVAQLAEQVREQRQPVAPDNPLLQWQQTMSQAIIAALDGYRDLRDRSIEQIFLGVYGSPVLQAMLGLRGSDTAPRLSPGIDPARAVLIKQRIAELKSRLAEGGPREAVIRALVYIGMAGPGVDERAFNELRQIRAEYQGLTLQAFKQVLREQFFSLMLDRDAALEGIAKMLPADAAGRKALLAIIHRTVEAPGVPIGERARRLAQIEAIFAAGRASKLPERAPRRIAASASTALPAKKSRVKARPVQK